MVFPPHPNVHITFGDPIPQRRTPKAERLQVLQGLLALRFNHWLRGVRDEVHAEAFLQGLAERNHPGWCRQGMDQRGWNLAKSWEKPLEMELWKAKSVGKAWEISEIPLGTEVYRCENQLMEIIHKWMELRGSGQRDSRSGSSGGLKTSQTWINGNKWCMFLASNQLLGGSSHWITGY